MLNQDTARIPLRAHDGEIRAYAVIDATDAAWAEQWTWRLANGYAVRHTRDKARRFYTIRLHRELLGLPWISDGRTGDHIDRDRLNCRRYNLRVLPKGKNPQNRPSDAGSASAYRGVDWRKEHMMWRARVMVNGRSVHLGYFTDELEAAEAARVARKYLLPFSVD